MIEMTSRERRLLVGLVAAVAIWALYALAVGPARDRVRTLQRIIPQKQAELQELQAKGARYTALRNDPRECCHRCGDPAHRPERRLLD